MFNETPDDNIGLEWEPCHQLVYLIDPLPQIRKWAHKFFHVHGKDATVRWDVIREHGIFGKEKFVFMRTPGFGDSNWTDIISELRLAGCSGSHRHRRLARSGLSRRARNDRPGRARSTISRRAAAATSSTSDGELRGRRPIAAAPPD